MQIRKAEREDLEACYKVDPSYVTEQVWQLDEGKRGAETHLTFREVRLPRPIRADYPRTVEGLWGDWDRRECFLVAEEEGAVRGFLDLIVPYDQNVGWVKHVIVAEGYRRQGVGTQLLRAALGWCEYHHLPIMMAECQAKNHPAISFYQKNGLAFCGYNDMYYIKDIALFFAAKLTK